MEHDTIPPPPKPYKPGKSLVIAVVVSALFLLAAAGICVWLLTKPAPNGVVTQAPTGDGSESVKKVSWITAPTLSASYARREQNTQSVTTTYYFDAAAGCGITTSVQPAQSGVAIKQGVLDAAKAAQAYGIAVTSNTDADDHKIKDADGQHTYTFPAMQLEQSVAVAGVPYDSQRTVVAFKQFGASVASIGYSCKTAAWDSKKAELQTFVNAFTVKTEK